MQNRLLLLLLFIVIYGVIPAQQQTLWLLKGKTKTILDYKLSTNGVDSVLIYTTLKGDQKQIRYDEVFGIQKSDGSEEVIYNPAIYSALNFIPDVEVLNVNQMRSYLHGMNDAKQVHLSLGTAFISAGIGLGSAFIPPVAFSSGPNSMDIPLGVIVPISTIIVTGTMGTSDEKMEKYFPDKMNDESYLIGAEETFRKKRLRQSIIGSIIGFTAGFIIVQSL